jgi:hypothetical protein
VHIPVHRGGVISESLPKLDSRGIVYHATIRQVGFRSPPRMAAIDGAYAHINYRVTARDRCLLVAEARRRNVTLSHLVRTRRVDQLLRRLRDADRREREQS